MQSHMRKDIVARYLLALVLFRTWLHACFLPSHQETRGSETRAQLLSVGSIPENRARASFSETLIRPPRSEAIPASAFGTRLQPVRTGSLEAFLDSARDRKIEGGRLQAVTGPGPWNGPRRTSRESKHKPQVGQASRFLGQLRSVARKRPAEPAHHEFAARPTQVPSRFPQKDHGLNANFSPENQEPTQDSGLCSGTPRPSDFARIPFPCRQKRWRERMAAFEVLPAGAPQGLIGIEPGAAVNYPCGRLAALAD